MTKLLSTTARALAGGVALAVLAHGGAAAQQAVAPSAPATDQSATGVEEVIVTAEKRSVNVQNAPLAITALSANRIDQGNLDRPESLQYAVPGLVFSSASGFTYLTIRGIGPASASLADSTVATYQDGIYTGTQIGESVPTFDLQRIEVLRGPQGTLYGRNTTGGVINYISRDPSFEPGALGSISYGNFNAVEANLGLTGPLVTDRVAARFSLHYADHDGYYQNVQRGVDEYSGDSLGGRLAVLFHATDNLDLTLRADASQDNNDNNYALLSSVGLDGLTTPSLPLGVFSEPAAFFGSVPGLLSPSDIAKLGGGSIADFYGLTTSPRPTPDSQRTETVADWAPTAFDTKAEGISLTADWDLGSVNVKSITAARYATLLNVGEVAGTPYAQLYEGPIIMRDRQYTQEFDVSGSSFDNKLDWLAGAFGYHSESLFVSNSYLPTFGQIVRASTFLANPPGSTYAFNLNPATLPSLDTLPGVFASHFTTAVTSGPGFAGEAPLTAGIDTPATEWIGDLARQNSDSGALFVQGTYHVTDKLRVTGGLRYTWDHKEVARTIHSNLIWDLTANGIFNAVNAGFLPPSAYSEAGIAAAGGLCEAAKASQSWEAPTGVIRAEYDLAPGVLTYASVSRGYHAGGFNNGGCNDDYNPEYLTDYETGLKAVFADGQILTNLAVYYYDYSNIQFTVYANATSSQENASSAKAIGAELEYAIRPHVAPGLQLDGFLAFEDSQYGQGCFADPANTNNAGFLSSPDQACPATVINPNTGLPVPVGSSANIDGNQLIRAPRWKANFGVQYQASLGDAAGNLMVRLDAAWTDRQYNTIWNDNVAAISAATQPSYWILNGVLSWSSPDRRYSIEAFGENLTNTIYFNNVQAFNAPATEYNVAGQLAPPRTYGVRLRVKLGEGY
jgi:iron complex outermembrane receptor protein